MDLLEKRLKICKECPLYMITEYGPRCNKRKFLHPDGRVSWLPKEGFIQGCNCLIEQRAANPEKHCVCGK